MEEIMTLQEMVEYINKIAQEALLEKEKYFQQQYEGTFQDFGGFRQLSELEHSALRNEIKEKRAAEEEKVKEMLKNVVETKLKKGVYVPC